ncbi:MAG: acylphosphatase [Patescibacteria group bacterium]
MHERLEAVVSGRVQMVMYRDFAQRKAKRLKLVGTVENLSNGTVRVIAEGPRDVLEQYVARLEGGPLLAHVEGVTPLWLPAIGGFRSFDIIY